MAEAQCDSGGEEQNFKREYTDSSSFSSLDYHDKCSSEESLYSSTLNKLMVTESCSSCTYLDIQDQVPKLVYKNEQMESDSPSDKMQVDDNNVPDAKPEHGNGSVASCEPSRRSMGTDAPSLRIPMRSDQDLITYAGIDFEILNKLDTAVSAYESEAVNHQQIKELGLDARNRIILCLSKLKHNLEFEVVAIFYGITREACAINFFYTVRILAKVIKQYIIWPTRAEILRDFPRAFEGCENTRVVLISQKIPLEKSRCSKCSSKLSSFYNSSNSIKVLIGLSPQRQLTFLSKAFSGNESKKSMFNKSGILKMLEPGKDATGEQESIFHSRSKFRRPLQRSEILCQTNNQTMAAMEDCPG
ncbi:hypothetical protein QAD02_016398 [Eretmocerus hayati]|uniref:Uncharacterized protein n=1 Tax=Eretmocerus hayati TaxID=131215 RepID=A0ACC2PC81_9HYME|nr:hypothetical protein QAD02_016398 [Eretmocerus hayati]